MECCQGSIVAIARIALPRCFPKASAKVRQIFELTNYLQVFFQKNREKINYAVLHAQLLQFTAKYYKNQQT